MSLSQALKDVYSRTLADVRIIAEVYGLEIASPIVLSNAVELTSFERLPFSPYIDNLNAHSPAMPGLNQISFAWPPIAATKIVRNLVARPLEDRFRTDAGGSPEDDILRSVKGFTLVAGAAPVVHSLWSEFVDPALALAESERTYSVPHFDGSSRALRKFSVSEEDVERINRYLNLRGKTRNAVELAVERLNIARRRISPGDKAIDGGICLECLLGDEEKTEINYKLKLRSALLVGKTLGERKAIKKKIGTFNSLRSKTVHGRQPTRYRSEDIDCAEQGLAICTKVLHKIVDDGALPNLELLELSPPTIEPEVPVPVHDTA
jgi:hypothetical protein